MVNRCNHVAKLAVEFDNLVIIGSDAKIDLWTANQCQQSFSLGHQNLAIACARMIRVDSEIINAAPMPTIANND